MSEWIAVSSLNSDPTYNRETDPNVIKRMVANWDPAKCETITANRRQDGSLWVVEGQKRVTALRIKEGPGAVIGCRVVEVGGPAEEKALFDAINNGRSRLTAGQKVRSDLNYNVGPWPEINKIVRQNGFFLQFKGTPAGGKKDWFGIRSMDVLETLHRRGILGTVLNIISACWGGRPKSTEPAMLKGMARFLTLYAANLSGPDCRRLVERLRAIDPAQVIVRSKDYQAHRSQDDRIAEAICSFYNANLPRSAKKLSR